MTWPTPEDLADRLGVTDINYPKAQSDLDAARAAVQAAARQRIEYVAGDQVELVGNWTDRLFLPQLPVTDVTAVTIFHGSVFVNEFPLGPNDYRWSRRGLVRRVGYVAGRLLAPSSGYWGGDQASVRFTYSHGNVEIPSDIFELVLVAAARQYRNPSGLVMSERQIGNYTERNEYGPRSAIFEILTPDEKASLRRKGYGPPRPW